MVDRSRKGESVVNGKMKEPLLFGNGFQRKEIRKWHSHKNKLFMFHEKEIHLKHGFLAFPLEGNWDPFFFFAKVPLKPINRMG